MVAVFFPIAVLPLLNLVLNLVHDVRTVSLDSTTGILVQLYKFSSTAVVCTWVTNTKTNISTIHTKFSKYNVLNKNT